MPAESEGGECSGEGNDRSMDDTPGSGSCSTYDEDVSAHVEEYPT